MSGMVFQVKELLSGALAQLRPNGRGADGALEGRIAADLIARCDLLLEKRGGVSASRIAGEVLQGYAGASPKERNAFLAILAERYGADAARLDAAIERYRARRDAGAMAEIHAASESRRQQLIHELNQASGGTLMLLRMREHALASRAEIPGHDALDADFREVLASWFNRGFLALKRIDWSSPASVLRKIIEHEAVHEIKDWDDLRARVEPGDRRCYALFHPQMPDEPLIFVEVALTNEIPASIQSLLAARAPGDIKEPSTAVFYSISNCQSGLKGVPFGSFLIKQTAELLKAELPSLKTFVTLSPVPDFAKWLERERALEGSPFIRAEERAALEALDKTDGAGMPEGAREVLLAIAARFFLRARAAGGRPYDSVARFHLGNGAELAQIHWLADTSHKGLKQAHGLMVNYRYDLKRIEQNQRALLVHGDIVASPAIHKLARAEFPPHERLLAFWRRGADQPAAVAETD